MACSICSAIPRSLSDETDIRKAAAALTPPLPPDDEAVEHLQCPECGRGYLYSRSEEWDDGRCYATISLQRKPKIAPLLGDAWERREAAWSAMQTQPAQWPALIGHADADVREEAVMALSERAGLDDATLRSLVPLQRDARAAIRAQATRLVARWRLQRGEALVDELLGDGDPVRCEATLRQMIHVVPRDARRLAPFLAHADDAVRRAASRVMQLALESGTFGDEAPLVDVLRGDGAAPAEAALRAMLGSRRRCDALTPLLARWCEHAQTRFEAIRLASKQCALGTDVSPVLPVVAEQLRAGHDPAERCKLLITMMEHAPDKLAVARAMLAGVGGYWFTSLLMAITANARKGHDFSSLVSDLRATENDYNRAWLKEAIAAIEEQAAGG